ncbi:MAG: cupin domain-containing protein [Bryobacterales bacterium]|nr:cupin domain-containing protein [Bryobacterales bacterium]
MPHTKITDDLRTITSLYSLGALPPDEAVEFEKHLAEGCDVCRAELESLNAAVLQLAFAAPEVQPPASLRDRLLNAIAPLPEGMHIVRNTEGRWVATAFPGVTMKTLHFDKQTFMVTNLLKMEPKSSIPPHRHTAMEQCLVLEGDVRQDGVAMGPGDYSRNDPQSHHGRIYTENGCLLLLISCAKDEFSAA